MTEPNELAQAMADPNGRELDVVDAVRSALSATAALAWVHEYRGQIERETRARVLAEVEKTLIDIDAGTVGDALIDSIMTRLRGGHE